MLSNGLSCFQTALLLKTQAPLFTEGPSSGSLAGGAKACPVEDRYRPIAYRCLLSTIGVLFYLNVKVTTPDSAPPGSWMRGKSRGS